MEVSNTSHDDFGDAKLPPGILFDPDDDVLVVYFLKRKICRRRLRGNFIGVLDVYNWDPEELPSKSVSKTGDRQWFFFSHRVRRHRNGDRKSRKTKHGYWKVTGNNRDVTYNNRTVGVKKSLVFYKGRASSGERTNWMMNEYTIAEEELKRCPTATQDPYVLYKVYKKSGRGPKNGERYGAPFREEDWTDEDDPVDAVQPINVIPSADSFIVLDQGQLPEIDIEESIGQMVDHSTVDQPRINEVTHALQQVGGKEETLSAMVDPSLGEAVFIEPRLVLHPGGQHSVAQASFEVTLSATSNMYSCDAPKVTSAPNISEHNHYAVEEDFLEINDLLDPEPSFPEMGNAGENLHLQEMIGWDEPDLHFDAVMFLKDLGHGTLQVDMASQLNYQMSSHTDDTNNVSGELWTHDQRSSIFVSSESDQVVFAPPSSGFVYAGSATIIPIEARQNQVGNEGEPQDSWISFSK
ncbi:NAC domain-containing protein 17-like [Telopea speciosissima]|uniref:NAC domain-containing protein 17-like n=1 Tax=Telopea speciosissima TaxID=54955 RepID=UPI001CC6C416|nr:NAC domain-containing protein 17-like [Telopea speciosissima]